MKTMLQGKVSTFGGPEDKGVKPDEGLALVDAANFDAMKDYFLSQQPTGTTGLARRLNPETPYIACRWEYATTPKKHLTKILVDVKNPQNGKSVQAKPVDWGPAAWTDRIADLSPGLARQLGVKTGDVCVVEIPHPGTGLSTSRAPDAQLAAAGHRAVLTEGKIKAVFGAFDHRDSATQPGAIRILPPWPKENLVEIMVPQLKGLPHYGNAAFSGKFACHKKAAQSLVDAFAAIEQQGLKDKLLFWGGCHVPRHKSWDPKRGLSSHSWGIAIDLNVQWNGYNTPPAAKGRQGSVVEIVPLFESFGFAWGGYFSTCDGMHFEYAPEG